MSEQTGLSLSMIVYFLIFIIIIDCVFIMIDLSGTFNYVQSINRGLYTESSPNTGSFGDMSYEVINETSTQITYEFNDTMNLILIDTLAGHSEGFEINKTYTINKIN